MAQGNASNKNNRYTKWGTVVKGHKKKSEKMIHNRMVKSVPNYEAETWSLYGDDRRRTNGTEMDALR
jgi:hypothetical protein